MLTSPEPLPNAEFVMNCFDRADPAAHWAITREPSNNVTWLMPDFGFWSWPEPHTGAFTEIRRKAIAMEERADENPTGKAWSWEQKIPKLLFRGASMNAGVRTALNEQSKDKPWADVRLIKWSEADDTMHELKSPDEHCQYKYLAYVEGVSYSGRMKYLQMCRSVMVSHSMHWQVHVSHLLKSSGPDQNYVEVKDDFSNLDETMKELLADDAKAKRIADKQTEVFRDRYLTPAANVCYWRRLIHAWREISFEPDFYKMENGVKVWRGVPIESWVIMKKTHWDPY